MEEQADKPVTQPVEHPLDIIMPGILLIKRTLSTSRTTCLIDRYSSRHGMMTVSSAFILSLLVTFLFVPYPHPDVLDRGCDLALRQYQVISCHATADLSHEPDGKLA